MIPAGWRCPRRVGFLFPHPCERATPVGCPDCDSGRVQDPYSSRMDRGDYSNDYEIGGASAIAFGGGDSGGGGASMDFSETDGASLVDSNESFEDDASAS